MTFLSRGPPADVAAGFGRKRAGRRRTNPGLFYSGLALGVLSWGVTATGCVAGHPPAAVAPPAAAPARLAVKNLTDYVWRLSATLPNGAEIWAREVGPRSAIEVELAAGDYVIEQAVVSGNVGPGLTRQVPARFESGQTYRWRLGTLLSTTTPEAGERR